MIADIPWATTTAVFLGTLPLLGLMAWNMVEIKSFRAEVRAEFISIRTEISAIKAEITNIRERLATLEERDRLTHPVIVK